jgi:hypothetical protein
MALVFVIPNHPDIVADLDKYADKADETAKGYEAVHPKIGNPHTKGDLVTISFCIIGAVPDHYHQYHNDYGEIEKTNNTADGPW